MIGTSILMCLIWLVLFCGVIPKLNRIIDLLEDKDDIEF